MLASRDGFAGSRVKGFHRGTVHKVDTSSTLNGNLGLQAANATKQKCVQSVSSLTYL